MRVTAPSGEMMLSGARAREVMVSGKDDKVMMYPANHPLLSRIAPKRSARREGGRAASWAWARFWSNSPTEVMQ
eukprot:CAMPEP_0204369600 /NCGR_PEP_ID=MMETSP0469-20131031/45099_1 /ASSEMBLY_ACC=CAM_ASM_000384 /TAXON_ID=2969 /ORGANISM="Oxyrrhis marina" /LENGTH=73 /DNA_ID=CAMNT_0051359371 /DNA_START=8 /DNA_END=229 /DNA_ORIENTATION=+